MVPSRLLPSPAAQLRSAAHRTAPRAPPPAHAQPIARLVQLQEECLRIWPPDARLATSAAAGFLSSKPGCRNRAEPLQPLHSRWLHVMRHGSSHLQGCQWCCHTGCTARHARDVEMHDFVRMSQTLNPAVAPVRPAARGARPAPRPPPPQGGPAARFRAPGR